MGRPPLGNKPTQVRLPPGVGERIDALDGPGKRAAFIREAVVQELAKRERRSPSPEYIVADLSGERQRFLGISAGSGGGWVVKATAADAKTFVDVDLAQAALGEWTGPIRRPFEWGHWKVYEIAGPETFLEVE